MRSLRFQCTSTHLSGSGRADVGPNLEGRDPCLMFRLGAGGAVQSYLRSCFKKNRFRFCELCEGGPQ